MYSLQKPQLRLHWIFIDSNVFPTHLPNAAHWSHLLSSYRFRHSKNQRNELIVRKTCHSNNGCNTAPITEMLWKITLTGFIDKLVPHIALIEGIGKMDDCPHRQRHLYNRNWFSAN